jgi:glycosyltransferase involved in cell wall biosynthesis
MDQLSALILTYNEEDNIRECLESVNWIERVVVIDSYSEDKTRLICEEFNNVDFYQNYFKDFSSQRNYGLAKIESEWVFIIDADERVTESLKNEIQNLSDVDDIDGFNIMRKNYFLGKWVKCCGWHPDYNLRLFRNKYRYEGVVHEKFNVEGKVKKLNNGFIHYTYKSTKEYAKKIIQYADLGAEKEYNSGKKVSIIYIFIRTILEFIKLFIFQKGFLGGVRGFILSIMMSFYKFLKYTILWEKNHGSENG